MHQIVFRDVQNGWHNALPAGNGRMGAMVFFKDRALHIALNHYDCYYGILPPPKTVSDSEQEEGKTFADPARFLPSYEELCTLAAKAKEKPDYEASHYLKTLHPLQNSGRPSYHGTSYPMGGEAVLYLDERVDLSKTCLTLEIEKGRICFWAGGQERAEAVFFIPQEEDVLLMQLSQTADGLWKSGVLTIPSQRGLSYCRTEKQIQGDLFRLRTVYAQEGSREKKEQEALLYLPGAEEDDGRMLLFPAGFRELTAGVLLESSSVAERQTGGAAAHSESGFMRRAAAAAPEEETSSNRAARLVGEADRLAENHRAGWELFWKSSVSLPDQFLETLWHLHVYLMGCTLGPGSAYPEQTCGLSGLWDIRRPNMWGSMWYWDVNIQSAFWGTASSGHPELLKVFCDGYLKYEQDIRRYTKQVYGKDGWALDYPHPLYNCIQPWCAGILWEYFIYTRDRDFLKNKAYPVFREQITFFRWLAKKDKAGICHVEPDISPEQGPVTRDSVITIACVKRLLQAGIEASRILKRPSREREEMEYLLTRLPAYERTRDGRRWKDSASAQENLYLRHPSVLMPVFPAQEVTAASLADERYVAEQTLLFAAEQTETGTFGAGWLAASAAVLGKGDMALQLLYEKGLDHTLHSNGLGYEESERFINYCHVTKPAHYLPAMCEASGGIVVTVNRMLLQADDVISVFPALPKGLEQTERGRLQYREERDAKAGENQGFDTADFTGLAAPGGFLISAAMKNRKVIFIKAESTAEARLRLRLPGELTKENRSGIFEKQMKPGDILTWGEESGLTEKEKGPEVPVRMAAQTSRRIFLGEDRHTAFYKAVDAFTCAYRFADQAQYEMTPYIFDFGRKDTVKNYDAVYPAQSFLLQQCLVYCGGPIKTQAKRYDGNEGYGFLDVQDIRVQDRNAPDDLRRDFLEGSAPAEFLLELPAGKYDLLVISGDEAEASRTDVSLPQYGTYRKGEEIAAGRYQCRILPVMHEQDGRLSLRLETEKGRKWKLNALFVNKQYALL